MMVRGLVRVPVCEDKHGAQLHRTPLGSLGVGAEIFRKRLLELERNAASHHDDAIHRIDEGFGVFGQDVTRGEAKHRQPLRSSQSYQHVLRWTTGSGWTKIVSVEPVAGTVYRMIGLP